MLAYKKKDKSIHLCSYPLAVWIRRFQELVIISIVYIRLQVRCDYKSKYVSSKLWKITDVICLTKLQPFLSVTTPFFGVNFSGRRSLYKCDK